MDQFPDWDFPSDQSNASSFTLPLLSPPPSPPPPENISILTHIERIIISLTATLTQTPSASSLSIPLHSRRPQTTYFSPHTSSILPLPHTHPSHFTNTTFPRNPRQFACILTLLSILHAHHSSTSTPLPPPLTKRQIYYHNPTLFRSQRSIDHLLDSLAATFRLTRRDLGICAAGKGLVYGDIYIGGAYFGGEGSGGLIPPSFSHESVILAAGVRGVLLVEKETIFRALSSLRSGIVQEGLVMLCGKGYPDLNTRRLLLLLWERKCVERVATLVDFDPDGVEIAATYKFGSTLLAHERVAVHGVDVAGVLSRDLISLITSATADCGGGGGVVVTTLTLRDRKKALALLTRPWMPTTPSWKVEIQRMLFWGIKCEVEVFYSGACFARWVLRRVGKAVI
ncbi:Spo11/DNA topoisomerase VI subunit A [Tuber indicum]|nr:Spo11/DNA topoisomerase VI subunit A [Tuber indicum]